MKQKEKFDKFIIKYGRCGRTDLLERIYSLERYIERLDTVFKSVVCISDKERADFSSYLKGGPHA